MLPKPKIQPFIIWRALNVNKKSHQSLRVIAISFVKAANSRCNCSKLPKNKLKSYKATITNTYLVISAKRVSYSTFVFFILHKISEIGIAKLLIKFQGHQSKTNSLRGSWGRTRLTILISLFRCRFQVRFSKFSKED